MKRPVSSAVKHNYSIGTGDLGFDFRDCQIGAVSLTAHHGCNVSSKLCCSLSRLKPRRWAPPLVTLFGVIALV